MQLPSSGTTNFPERVVVLAHIKGIADATKDTLDALPRLFKEPRIVEEDTLRRLYGPRDTPTRESTSTTITPDMVKKCLEVVAPLPIPTRTGGGHSTSLLFVRTGIAKQRLHTMSEPWHWGMS
jgi:hypothetical protein